MDNSREIEIDLLDLLRWLKKKIWIIVAVCLLSAFAGALYTAIFMEDEYTASTRIYVLNRSSETTISASDYSVSNYLVNDYAVLITGDNVTSEVVNQLNLDMTSSEMQDKISVSAIDSTRVLQIEVVDTDAQRAAAIANCVREIASRQIKQIMDVDAVNLVYQATVPQSKSGPSLTKNTVLTTLVGGILVIGVLTVIYVVDDSIRTEEDVERYLGLNVLGVIPETDTLSRQRPGANRAGRLAKKRKALWTKLK